MREGTKRSRLYKTTRKRVGAGDPEQRRVNSELETKEEAGRAVPQAAGRQRAGVDLPSKMGQ